MPLNMKASSPDWYSCMITREQERCYWIQLMQDFQALNHFQDAVSFYKTRIIDSLTGVNSTDITQTPQMDPPGLGSYAETHAKEPEPPRANCGKTQASKDHSESELQLDKRCQEMERAQELQSAHQAHSSVAPRREAYFSNSKHNWLALVNDQPDDLTQIDSEVSITTPPMSVATIVKPNSGLTPEVVKMPSKKKADRCLLCYNEAECSTLCASCEREVGASSKPSGLQSSASDVEILKLHPGCTPKVVKLHPEYEADRCLLCYDKVKYSALCAFCDEDLVDLDPAEKQRDYLLHASIALPPDRMQVVGMSGIVRDIHIEVISRRKLYWVSYADGEVQHLPVGQVRRLLTY